MATVEKGTLWKQVNDTTRQALEAGALLPITTNAAFIEEQGVRFFVRVLEALRRKDEARKSQQAASQAGRKVNPFLPPEPELTVGDVSPTHVAVLNKFNVVDHHLLIVTRSFEDQTMLLTVPDFEALWFCMSEYDSLGFYNGGAEAGASQQHKHLQVVPLPLAPEGPVVPAGPLLESAGSGPTVQAFPFLHAYRRMDDAASSADPARSLFDLYCSMLEQVGLTPPDEKQLTRQSMPYCLLVTRSWMLLVPRSREHFETISLNSLAYAGSFFVRSNEELDLLKKRGVMNALAAVAVRTECAG